MSTFGETVIPPSPLLHFCCSSYLEDEATNAVTLQSKFLEASLKTMKMWGLAA